MLDQMRTFATGWIARILIALLVLSFAVWGVADVFRGFSNDVVIAVGDSEVSATRYQFEFNRQLEQYSQSLGKPLTLQEARRYGVDRNVLSRLTGMAALNAGTKDLGLVISDDAVARDIQQDETFHGPYGRFDRQQFDSILRSNRIDESSFVEDRRNFMTRDQLLASIVAGNLVPPGLTRLVYAYQQEKRIAYYLLLTPDFIKKEKEPTEEDITAFYEENPTLFTQPQTRDFSTLSINPQGVAGNIEISEEELAAEFENRRNTYDIPEKRTLLQISASNEARAADFASRLRQGDLENVLREAGTTAEDARLQDATRLDLLSPEIADAAFALKPGEVSEPVDGPLGYVVLKLDSVSPAVPSTLAGVREELLEQLLGDKAREEVFNLYDRIEDERSAGVSLDEIASQLGFDLVVTRGVDREGLNRNGKAVTVPDLPDLLQNAFRYEVGEEPEAVDTKEDGYYWIQVDAITATRLRPLKEVREQVITSWKSQQKKKTLTELAKVLADRGNAGESLDDIAREYGHTARVSPALNRNTSDETFSRLAVSNLYATPEGRFTTGPVSFGNSIILMQVREITVPSPDENTEEIKKVTEVLNQRIGNDIAATLVLILQNKHGVSVNQPVIEQMIGIQ